jgi:peroxiredoxin
MQRKELSHANAALDTMQTRLFFIPFLILVSSLFCVTSPAADSADKPEASDPVAGHSLHGDAFNEGPRQKAYLMEGMSKHRFPITTSNSEAQKFFNQAIAQLHGFWYFEAERSFRQIAAMDTNCAMAYWGMAMANINNAKRAKEFIKRAAALKSHGGRAEQMWIEALAKYYESSKDDKERRREYVRALEELVQEFPDDIEAKAFLVFQIWDNSNRGLALSSHQAVQSLINDVLRVDPMHPVHHYQIHLWDNEKPIRALTSAARCGQSTPGIAHMWHMPGHTFSKLHRYADAAWQQEASARVDHAQMMRDHLLPDQIHNYAHNNEWLIRDLSNVGRVHDAVELAKNMIELPRHPKYNAFEDKNRKGSSSYGRARLLDLLVRYELWDDALALSSTMYLEPMEIPEEQVKRLHALGLAYFNKGKADKGRQQIRELDDLLKSKRSARIADAEKAEEKAVKDKQSEDQIAKAMADAMKKHSETIRAIENAAAELKGFEAVSEKQLEAARKQFEQAKNIPKERLARIYLQLGDKTKAEQLAKEALTSGTNQVQLIANYVDVLQQCGKRKEAEERFEQLRSLSSGIDLDVPVFQRVKPIAEAKGFSANWRIEAPQLSDNGERPALAQLGPFRWQPSPAVDWSLPDRAGKLVSLKQYRGKPLLVLFYLGKRCSHCMEQLNAFAPAAKDFADAGISLVAIGNDPVDLLKETLQKSSESFPFPLLSDRTLTVFKAYRAYDDFEEMPLHGAYLVDGNGLIRWQDISFEPFKDTKFVLNESKRLLALSAATTASRSDRRSGTMTAQRNRAVSPRGAN